MTPKTLEKEEIVPDVIGNTIYRYELSPGFCVLPLMADRSFFVPVQTIKDEVSLFPSPVISFNELADKLPDCDGKFVTCVQFSRNGSTEEKRLSLWDFIHEVYFTNDEPYFTEKQRKEYRNTIEETLLDIIDSKYK